MAWEHSAFQRSKAPALPNVNALYREVDTSNRGRGQGRSGQSRIDPNAAAPMVRDDDRGRQISRKLGAVLKTPREFRNPPPDGPLTSVRLGKLDYTPLHMAM